MKRVWTIVIFGILLKVLFSFWLKQIINLTIVSFVFVIVWLNCSASLLSSSIPTHSEAYTVITTTCWVKPPTCTCGQALLPALSIHLCHSRSQFRIHWSETPRWITTFSEGRSEVCPFPFLIYLSSLACNLWPVDKKFSGVYDALTTRPDWKPANKCNLSFDVIVAATSYIYLNWNFFNFGMPLCCTECL